MTCSAATTTACFPERNVQVNLGRLQGGRQSTEDARKQCRQKCERENVVVHADFRKAGQVGWSQREQASQAPAGEKQAESASDQPQHDALG